MLYEIPEIRPFGPYSGTCASANYHSADITQAIAVDYVMAFSRGLTLTGASSEDRGHRRGYRGPQPAVVRSLERSLVAYADIWSELAKH